MRGFKQYSRLSRRQETESCNTDKQAVDSVSVVSSTMFKSAFTDATSGDDLTDHESKLLLQLTGNSQRRAQNCKKTNQRRKRGASLERQISQVILRTAAASADGTYLGIEPPLTHSVCSSRDILKDLASYHEEVVKSKPNTRTEHMVESSTGIKEEVDRDPPPPFAEESPMFDIASIEQEVNEDAHLKPYLQEKTAKEQKGLGEKIPSLAEAEPALPKEDEASKGDFMPTESFESLSWHGLQKLSKKPPKKSMPLSLQSKITVKSENSRAESVVFKTNFNDWSKFEPADFLPAIDARYSETIVDSAQTETGKGSTRKEPLRARLEESYPTRQMSANKIVSDHGRLPRTFLGNYSERSRGEPSPPFAHWRQLQRTSDKTCSHPDSPDSILNFPSAASGMKFDRSVRMDPPASYELGFPNQK